MNGDALELAGMIQAAEQNLTKQISDLRATVAEGQGNLGARVDALEKANEDDKKWEKVRYLAGPILVGLHIIAHKLGLNI